MKEKLQLVMVCHVYAKMMGPHAHVGGWLCELYVQCGSHIC